jgi:hypothetical protein
LNARGQINSETNIYDISTPQITVSSPPTQRTDEGGDLMTLLQATSVVTPGTAVVDAVQRGAPTVEEAQNVITESVTFPTQSDIIEISVYV